MKRILCIAIWTMMAAGLAQAAPAAALWEKANQAYQQKAYDSAAALYEQVVKQQPAATAYYNLGNAYYRANKIGPAVLNYEKALRIDPGFKQAQDNLLLTQNRIGNRVQQAPDIFFMRWWEQLTSGHKANQWAVINIVLLLALLGLILYKRFRRPAWLLPQITAGVTVLWLLVLVVAIQSAANAAAHDKAVVMRPDTLLMADPQTGKNMSLLPEGTKVSILGRKKGSTEIKLGDGRTGWVADTAIAVI